MEHIYSSYLFQFSLTGYTMISILGLFASIKTFWGGYSHVGGRGGGHVDERNFSRG